MFNNVTIRLLGSDDFPVGAKRQADAHARVDAGSRGRVLLAVGA